MPNKIGFFNITANQGYIVNNGTQEVFYLPSSVLEKLNIKQYFSYPNDKVPLGLGILAGLTDYYAPANKGIFNNNDLLSVVRNKAALADLLANYPGFKSMYESFKPLFDQMAASSNPNPINDAVLNITVDLDNVNRAKDAVGESTASLHLFLT